MASAFSALTGWTLFASLGLAIGALTAYWLLFPRCVGVSDEGRRRLAEEGASVGFFAAVLVTAGLGLYFARQLAEFHDPFAPWAEDARLLLGGTPWGRTWSGALAASLFLLACFALARRGRTWAWWLATPAALGLGTFPGLTGHAAGAERLRSLVLMADTMHVWAMGAWLGTLCVVLFLERRSHRGSGGLGLETLVPAFSPIAIASVAVLVISGVFASWTHLPGWSALVSTEYGRALVLKLVVVALVLGVGGVNWRVVTPRLGSDSGDRLMARTTAVELALAQLVLLATAILVRLSPTGH